MKSISTYKRGLTKAKKLARQGEYRQAWDVVERLLQDWPENPNLLVLWADLLQLQDNEHEYSLDDVRATYEKAAHLDSQSPAPLIELGHFQFSVDDDADSAIKSYEKAVSLSTKHLHEALMGKAKALREAGFSDKAFECFAQAYWLQNISESKRSNGSAKELLENWETVED